MLRTEPIWHGMRAKGVIWISLILKAFGFFFRSILHFSLHLLLPSLFSTWSAFLPSPLFFIFLCSLSLSHCVAPVSWLPVRQCGPRGSNQLNYWEHKNAAANGSWINTLAKLLPWHPLLPRGIKLKILRLRMQTLEAIAVALFVAMTHLGHPKALGVQRANLTVIVVIYGCKNWHTIHCFPQLNSTLLQISTSLYLKGRKKVREEMQFQRKPFLQKGNLMIRVC